MGHLRISYCYLLQSLSFLAPSHPYLCLFPVFGIKSFDFLSQHFGAPPCSKPEDNPEMPPRRAIIRLQPQDPPPQESINQATASLPQVKPLNEIRARHPHRKRSLTMSKSMIGMTKLRKKQQQQKKKS
jgi:hypothetical protein